MDIETGKVYYNSEFGDDMDKFPEDIDHENYTEIPHKNKLDLGKKLVIEFSRQYIPGDVENNQVIFRKKEADSKVKRLLEDQEMLERWYEFESNTQKEVFSVYSNESAIEISG